MTTTTTTMLRSLLLGLPAAACGSLETSGADAGTGADATAEVDTVAPQLLSTSPVDGATGLFDDTVVVLVFSEPMNQASVEDTLDTVTLGSSTNTWNAAGDTLSIVPDSRLAYAEGLERPSNFSALDYRVIVGDGAVDLAGNELEERVVVNFTTLKDVGITLRPVAEMSRVATPEDFIFDVDSPFVVGDRLGNGTEEGMRSAMTFDLSGIPQEAVAVASANLLTRQLLGDTQGQPFDDLGPGLLLDHVSFAASGGANAAFNASQSAHSTVGNFFEKEQVAVDLDVSAEVMDDFLNRSERGNHSQFLARFESISNLDKGNDRAVFSREALELSLRYLHP